MERFDSHIHLFADQIIQNVQQKKEMVAQLKLQAIGAEKRSTAEKLMADMKSAGVAGALMLPTANATGVRKTNRHCIHTAAAYPFIKAAGTLHPCAPEMAAELAFLRRHGVRVLKLCSFSHGFVLDGPEALEMFRTIERANERHDAPFAVVLDTLYTADRHFGTRSEFNTTPKLLSGLAVRYAGIKFIAAHMGGLDAPYHEIRRHLTPRSNLYLDTSNAAHTLSKKEFCDLATQHGSDHLLFGTDWPWFSHEKEVPLIDDLLGRAGFNARDKNRVFHANIHQLLGQKGGVA